MQLKWIVALCAIAAFTLVAMTALDKYDERSCRGHPRVLQQEESHFQVDAMNVGHIVIDRPQILERCDGFLPW